MSTIGGGGFYSHPRRVYAAAIERRNVNCAITPRGREIRIHCSFGQMSYYVVRLLAQHGFNARNLSGGFTSYEMEQ